ncbi:hypothetical protein Tco_0705459 [Tanacetum coccineum]|uniref:Uncharacterized protein n=1 Tax=Tanacetum coccineum TaxID=301880 RepID=A0ABQ4Y6N0_9ASTR
MRQGWDPRYKIWVEHGEPAPPTPPPVIDNTRQPLMSDMTALLNDLSYILPNNEHNEPTQRDIGETSNEPTQATCNEFEELYTSANEELYPGCDYVTRLDFMAKFTYFKAKADVARSHGGDGGGDDCPPSHVVPTGCRGCFANKGKGKRKPNLGGKGAGRLNTRDKTQNLSLKEIAEAKGPVSISFEQGDKQTLNPLGPHAAHWSNYIGEVVRSVPLYYPSWEKVPEERKAAIISEIGVSYPFMFISLSCSFI